MPSKIPPPDPIDIFDDDEGWQDMPVVRENDGFADGLDEEDQKKYHYVAPSKKRDSGGAGAGNATGNLIDFDDMGAEWRSKQEQNESEYTRLRIDEEDESDEVHLRTRYLFDEDKAMTPLSQMQATKNLLTEAQRIAYVGVCFLTSREMSQAMRNVKNKELKAAIQSMELWALKIMGRLYYHMEILTEEQKMIESLSQHGVQTMDLVPALMTTHTVANPEYDPAEARRLAEERERNVPAHQDVDEDTEDITAPPPYTSPTSPKGSADAAAALKSPIPGTPSAKTFQTTARVLEDTASAALPGVTTSLSTSDEKVTLDIRWTILCDLFLILIADSVYDARSRVLLEQVALKLGLGWLDVAKFERRVTEALEIQEDVEKMEQREIVEGRQQASKKRRYVMMGLATLGGGLVIGLSAGLLAPVIGAGLGAALTTVGITGTTSFLAGAGGAAVITTGGVLTGSSIAGRGMARRTQSVRTFDLLPLHNNKRVNCILTVPGFMTGKLDDVRLPFSVLDPLVGDVFSVLWEPDMIMEAGGALKILTSEVLSQLATTALQATVMTALMTALQWPIILTKLGYLIDNPWNNALDRAKYCGTVLADVLIQRHLGVRPITLIGFSLGSRVIFYALLELARHKAFGVVQDVFLLGTTVTASKSTWHQARSAVSGRFVNGYARNDWVLNYLFRATSGGLNTVAGLRPVENVPGLENVDVTDKIAGHMSYRTFMPLILDQLGFPVTADFFDEPQEPEFEEDRVVVREEDLPKKKGWFSRKQNRPTTPSKVSRPPSAARFPSHKKSATTPTADDDELPPRLPGPGSPGASVAAASSPTGPPASDIGEGDPTALPPARAGFDFAAIKQVIGTPVHDGASGSGLGSATGGSGAGAGGGSALHGPSPRAFALLPRTAGTSRAESAPPPMQGGSAATGMPFAAADVAREGERYASPTASSPGGMGAGSGLGELSGTLARSLSLSSLRGGAPMTSAQHPGAVHEHLQTLAADSNSDDAIATLGQGLRARPPPAPTLAYGGAGAAGWTPPDSRADSDSEDGYGFGAALGAGRATSAQRGGEDGSASYYGSAASTSASASPAALHDDPFGAGATAGALAFAGSDGSITTWGAAGASTTSGDRDPWSTVLPGANARAGHSRSGAGGFNANPWS